MSHNSYILLADIHVHNWSAFAGVDERGVNTRLKIILDEMDRAVDLALSKGVKRGYMAGDVFHTRGYVAPSVMNPLLERIKGHLGKGFSWRIEPGNHDLEGKNSDELGAAVVALRNEGCEVVTETTVYEDDKVVLIPWFHSVSELMAEIERVAEMLPNRGEYDLHLHAPLNGVLIGIPDHGLVPDRLAEFGFKRIFCGHYHNHKSFCDGRVFSIGASTHQTWSDPGTLAGFMFVTPKKALHVKSKAPSFVDFDDTWTPDEVEEHVKGNYVRVRAEISDPTEIAAIRDALLENGARDVSIIWKKKPAVSERTTSVEAGASLDVSVATYIKEKLDDDAELHALCADILTKAKVGEE